MQSNENVTQDLFVVTLSARCCGKKPANRYLRVPPCTFFSTEFNIKLQLNSIPSKLNIVLNWVSEAGLVNSFPQTPISLTLSCLKKHNIFNSRKTLLQETRFWKTLGIFLSATLFPSLGSVTDLKKQYLGGKGREKEKSILNLILQCFKDHDKYFVS